MIHCRPSEDSHVKLLVTNGYYPAFWEWLNLTNVGNQLSISSFQSTVRSALMHHYVNVSPFYFWKTTVWRWATLACFPFQYGVYYNTLPMFYALSHAGNQGPRIIPFVHCSESLWEMWNICYAHFFLHSGGCMKGLLRRVIRRDHHECGNWPAALCRPRTSSINFGDTQNRSLRFDVFTEMATWVEQEFLLLQTLSEMVSSPGWGAISAWFQCGFLRCCCNMDRKYSGFSFIQLNDLESGFSVQWQWRGQQQPGNEPLVMW